MAIYVAANSTTYLHLYVKHPALFSDRNQIWSSLRDFNESPI